MRIIFYFCSVIMDLFILENEFLMNMVIEVFDIVMVKLWLENLVVEIVKKLKVEIIILNNLKKFYFFVLVLGRFLKLIFVLF